MKKTSTSLMRFLLGGAVTAVFCLFLVQNPYLFEVIEAKLYDFRFLARGRVSPPDSVVIAAIDEKSLARLGRWPWGRDVMAQLVDKLARADAAVVAFDVIFPEAEPNDARFAHAVADAGNVILPVAFDLERHGAGVSDPVLERSAIVSVADAARFDEFPPIMSGGILNQPVPVLKESAAALAQVNMLPDPFDGTLRWEALFLGYHGALYPSLGVRAAALYKGIPPEALTVRATRALALGKTVVPTDPWGRMPIDYYGPSRTFPHVSVSDILEGRVGSRELGNRIVFVGATAMGIFDLRVTPFTAVMPGVEKHATVAASILEQRFIRKAGTVENLAFLVGSGLLLSLLLSRMRLLWGAVSAVAVLFLIAFTWVLLFSSRGIWVNLACPLGNAFFIFLSVTAWNYAFVDSYARRIRAMFSSYVTATIVTELINNPELAKLGGEKREVSVLFADVRGFTTFSESHSPEEVVAILNEYLGAMTDVVLKWGGTLDKFIGDAIMVFWNAPLVKENHAELALRCALEMQARLAELHRKWDAEGKPKLTCGIGINTGEVLVGNIGAEGKKMDYTVIGDHVNLASRVEALTRTLGADILVTGTTVAKVGGAVEAGTLRGMALRGVRRVIVKGKEQATILYEVSAVDPEAPSAITECQDQEPLRMTQK